jgi:hypothetical protein
MFLGTNAPESVNLVHADSAGLQPMIYLPMVSRGNRPPNMPYNPYPEDKSLKGAPYFFSWRGGDPDGDAVTYTFYFGDSTPPTSMVAQNLSQTNFNLPMTQLVKNQTYFWGIVAKDSHGAITNGPVCRPFLKSRKG